MSNQQLAFQLKHRNGFDGITESREPIPQATKHEVVVKIRGIALNFRDIAISTSQYPFPVKDNVIPCSDMAGDVVEVGDGVHGFAVADKVIAAFDLAGLYGPLRDWHHGQGGSVDGALRQYAAYPEQFLVKVPKDSPQSYTELASLVCTGVTTWNALYGNLPLKPGQVVLCLGKTRGCSPCLIEVYLCVYDRHGRRVHHWLDPSQSRRRDRHRHFVQR